MKLAPGELVTPNVRLLRPLGEGGMGAVWIAEHKTLGTDVAVKFLSRELLKDEQMRGRFAKEAAAASQVKSAHVVKIYDHGVTDTQVPFMVMELLEGEDLGARIRRERKLAPEIVAQIVTQLCKALQAAHDKTIVHRDVKPENVFLTNEGGEIFVKLLDFGVAKNDRVTELTLKRSTMAGEALGTPYYMSPEQYRSSKEIDHRTDLWSVGVVVYEALTGEVPFDAENLTSLAIVVNEAKPKPPTERAPELPKAIDAWFAKACARDREARFQSARELAEALRVALSLEVSSRISMPEADTSQRIIVTTGRQDADLSLRETAFATTGTQPAKKSRLPIVAGVVALAIGATAAIGVAMQTKTEAPRVTATTAPTAPSSVAPAETHPIATAAVASIVSPAASTTATTIKSAAPPPKRTTTPPPPQPSASHKNNDQIW